MLLKIVSYLQFNIFSHVDVISRFYLKTSLLLWPEGGGEAIIYLCIKF